MAATRSRASLVVTRLLIVGALGTLLVVGVIVLGPRVSFSQQQRLAHRLVTELARTANDDYQIKLRQIVALGDAATGALVNAAASDRADLALSARTILEQRLAAWRIRAAAEPEFDLVRPVSLLASALAVEVRNFGALGQQWAERMTLEIVASVADIPARQSGSILEDCSAVIAAIPARDVRIRSDVGSVATIEVAQGALLPDVRLPPLRSKPGTEPWKTPPDRYSPSEQSEIAAESDDTTSSPPLPGKSTWVPEWSQRERRERPPGPVKDTLREPPTVPGAEPVVDLPTPDQMAELLDKSRQRDTRSLLIDLQTAQHTLAGVIRLALQERGITAEELPLATKLLADDKAERLALINELKVLPARAARRWLRELLNDPDAEVRLAALTALATTNDPELPAIAREMAVRDTDQRVTGLAARLLRAAR